MTANLAAMIYTGLAVLPLTMHVALAVGAPLGRLTVGGRFDGKLPPLWRGLALVQVGLLIGLSVSMLDRAGVLALGIPGLVFWAAFALTLATFMANAASPSRPERILWGPVTFGMAVCACLVAFL